MAVLSEPLGEVERREENHLREGLVCAVLVNVREAVWTSSLEIAEDALFVFLLFSLGRQKNSNSNSQCILK